MAGPDSVADGTLVSSCGPAVTALGEIDSRPRLLTEVSFGVFDVQVGPDPQASFGLPDRPGTYGELPDASYTYVGGATDGGTDIFPVFYSQADDSYFVAGVDAIKYGLYGYSGFGVTPDGTYTTQHVTYDADPLLAGPVTTYSYSAADDSVACYCPGTRILTPAGERPIETLAVGDQVTTLDGQARELVWIGRRSYGGRFLARQPGVLPIRFRAGSLGGGLPRRDLRVSPCHAMYLDGHLVEAALLVNGTTIVQETGCTAVDYLHLELERHAVLLAEGAPSESYLEDGNRRMFQNGYDSAARATPADYCAPRIQAGFALEAIRQRLAA